MAFMPIMSLIMALDNISFIRDFMAVKGQPGVTYIDTILGKFIPGIKELLGQIKGVTAGATTVAKIGA